MANVRWNGFIGNLNGAWSNVLAWSTGALPTSVDTATIDQSGVYAVSEDTTALINGLTVSNANATLAFDTAAKTLTVTGVTDLNAGTIGILTTATLATGTFKDSASGNFAESAGALSVTGAGNTAFLATGAGSSFSLSGGAVTVTNGASFVGGTDTISGGTFNAGTLAASGSTLTLSGGVMTSSGATTLTSGSIIIQSAGTLSTGTFTESNAGHFNQSAGRLSVTGAGATFSVTGNGSSFNLSGGAVTVTNGATLAALADTISGGTFNAGTLAVGGKLTLSGGTLTSSGATTLANGTFLIQSAGTLITASLAYSGGTFTQSGGQVTAIGLANFSGGSDIISGGAFNAGTLTLSGSGNLTLSGGTVTIGSGGGGVSLAVGDKITMNGGAVLDATNGGIADSGSIFGFGTVKGVLSGTGNVDASGGVLDLTSNIGNSTQFAFQISSNSSSVLQLDGTVGSANTFNFLNGGGVLAYNNAAKGINENIVGFKVGSSKDQNTTTFVDFRQQANLTVSGSNVGSGTTGAVKLSDGSILNLSGLVGNSGGTWFVNTTKDASGTGTDVFLSTVCYAAGTRILTATGERIVESLLRGDIVLTLSGGELSARPVKWVGRRRIDLAMHPRPETVAPVRIQRGAFADNMPHRDLMVSPDHAIFVEGKLICAR